MKFTQYSHRYADVIINSDPNLNKKYCEFINTLIGITDIDLMTDFNYKKSAYESRGTSFKSISHSINGLLKERLLAVPDWYSEVDIFNDPTGLLGNTSWKLDFACPGALSVEVAFNHGEAIAWNLMKPVLASELNHVQKQIQTRVGIYVCATDDMKKAGNFDSASGSYEKVIRYLLPMMNQLTTPIMIIGLLPFDTFRIDKKTTNIMTF